MTARQKEEELNVEQQPADGDQDNEETKDSKEEQKDESDEDKNGSVPNELL